MSLVTKDKDNLIISKSLVSIVAGVIVLGGLGFFGYKLSKQPVAQSNQNAVAGAAQASPEANSQENNALGRKIITTELSKAEKKEIIAGIMNTIQTFKEGDVKELRKYLEDINNGVDSAKAEIAKITDDEIKQGSANYSKYFEGVTESDLNADNAEWSVIDGIYFVKITKNGEAKQFGAKNVNGVWR